MDPVDLEIAPIERSVRIVVVDLAISLRVFCTLDSQGDPAIRAELPACVLLPRREPAPALVGFGLSCRSGLRTSSDDQRGLESQSHRRLKGNCEWLRQQDASDCRAFSSRLKPPSDWGGRPPRGFVDRRGREGFQRSRSGRGGTSRFALASHSGIPRRYHPRTRLRRVKSEGAGIV